MELTSVQVIEEKVKSRAWYIIPSVSQFQADTVSDIENHFCAGTTKSALFEMLTLILPTEAGPLPMGVAFLHKNAMPVEELAAFLVAAGAKIKKKDLKRYDILLLAPKDNLNEGTIALRALDYALKYPLPAIFMVDEIAGRA